MGISGREIRTVLREAGLRRGVDEIAAAAAPALRLVTQLTPDDLPLGCTKLGGRPDVPPGFQWPRWRGEPLSFIGQIDLAEVAAFSCCDVLPRSGWLWFFYDAEQKAWGFDPSDRGSFAVIHDVAPREVLERKEIPADVPREDRFDPCGVEFRETLTLPPWGSAFVERLGLSDDEEDAYYDVLDALEIPEGAPAHQLMGHPSPIQDDMQLECQLAANGVYVGGPEGYRDPRRIELEKGAASWRLLLQVDSDDAAGLMWGDAGRLYFWIREEDLEACAFDRVWMILQCA